MIKKTFLMELGTEELPPKILRNIGENLTHLFTQELNNAKCNYEQIQWFATPRRVAIKIINLSLLQENINIKKYGPLIVTAFDQDGKITEAAKKWALSNNINISQATRIQTNKGERLVYYKNIQGRHVKEILPTIVCNTIKKISVPKLMRWGNSSIYFVRPVHTITLMLGREIIETTILGLPSNRIILGHRFMGESKLILDDADQYPNILYERGKVIADYYLRKNLIRNQAEIEAKRLGGVLKLTDELLEEVTSLVEWPVILTAKFEKRFLNIPVEVLIHTLQDKQKYFPLYDTNGQILPYFIFVTNIESLEPDKIILGNEKVIRPRLVDAEYFLKIDRQQSLEERLPDLKKIIFHKKLGTLFEKTQRLKILAEWIASKIGCDIPQSIRAALLSKCDLITNMVLEFPETQGIMGMYYARYSNELEEVAIALKEQYYPRFAGDKIPSNLISCSLAIADKLDTIVGILGISQYPKGDKDPFALRRNAIGILRIIIENKLSIDLKILINKIIILYDKHITNNKVIDEVIDFIFGRFLNWYQEKGYSNNVIHAVLAILPTCPLDFDARVRAVSYFLTLEESFILLSLNKRISNILSKTTDKLNKNINVYLLQESEEILLNNLLNKIQTKLESYCINKQYQEALIELTSLNKPIDNFFKTVRINTSNKLLRLNRLTLLTKVQELFLKVADISLLY
ncbi:glycine--tRNA ligase subunit beta [Candidatus Ishikawella capsulata]|nr:glycine--tRNA ligase subunit beta [Candidatus Ishikawaella capsulata]